MANIVLIVVLAVVVMLVLWIVLSYNTLINMRNRVQNAWSQIDVQLKRRTDLIPNLVESVKGYMKHEKTVLENVTKARTAMMQADSPGKAAKAENVLSGALKSLFAVAESYPTLKANENFMQLQEELSGTESKIAYARQFYNDSVQSYNTMLQAFPTNILAGMFRFMEREFFKTEESEREPVKVSF